MNSVHTFCYETNSALEVNVNVKVVYALKQNFSEKSQTVCCLTTSHYITETVANH